MESSEDDDEELLSQQSDLGDDSDSDSDGDVTEDLEQSDAGSEVTEELSDSEIERMRDAWVDEQRQQEPATAVAPASPPAAVKELAAILAVDHARASRLLAICGSTEAAVNHHFSGLPTPSPSSRSPTDPSRDSPLAASRAALPTNGSPAAASVRSRPSVTTRS